MINVAIPYLNDLGVVVNQTAKNEHVPEIERAGRTLKERVRAVWITFPYKLTNNISPRELFTGVRVDYKRDCRLGFGEYVQVSADNDITNTMQPRTYGAISLGSAGNLQGTYLFLSLLTWKIIRRRTWVEMPLPGEVIGLINRKALSGEPTTSEVSIGVGNHVINEDITYMDETYEKNDMDPLVEPIVGNPVGISVENYGNDDENLCSIQPPDENDDQYELDINDLNKTNETHREARIQDVGTDGPTEPQENINPAKIKWSSSPAILNKK
jgi:hypothetical protein